MYCDDANANYRLNGCMFVTGCTLLTSGRHKYPGSSEKSHS